MRLIQPTLLFLGMAIHYATASPAAGPSSGASNVNSAQQQLMSCLTSNCPNELFGCHGDANCKKHLFCQFGCGEDMRKCINCGVLKRSQDVLQCAADKKCFDLKNTCPEENAIDKKNPDNPNLVEQLAKNDWWAVLSLAPETDAFLKYPCMKVKYAGTGKNASIDVTFCMGNITTGQCETTNVNEVGQGNQEGQRGIIKFKMSGSRVVDPKTLTVHVHELSEDEYVLISVCKHDPIMQIWSGLTLFSKFRTFEDLLANSKDREKTETAIKNAIARQVGDHNQLYKINAATCNI